MTRSDAIAELRELVARHDEISDDPLDRGWALEVPLEVARAIVFEETSHDSPISRPV